MNITFDIMLRDHYITTMQYTSHHPVLSLDDITDFITDRLPTLRHQNFTIKFNSPKR